MLQLYKNIKKLRIEKGLTQEELAHLVGYTDRSSIAKIERGDVDLSQSKIAQFADILGTTPSEIMGWEQTEKPTVGEDDGLSERERQLIQLVRRLSDKQVDGLLDLLRSQQPQEK